MIGSIIFVKNSSLISWTIRKLTKSSFSHVCLSVTTDNSYIIETNAFNKVKIKQNKYRKCEIVDYELSETQQLQLLGYLMQQLEKKYDYTQILGFLFRLLGLSKKPNLWNTKKIICSELVDLSYKSIGVDLISDKLDGDIMPSDLVNTLLKSKNQKAI